MTEAASSDFGLLWRAAFWALAATSWSSWLWPCVPDCATRAGHRLRRWSLAGHTTVGRPTIPQCSPVWHARLAGHVGMGCSMATMLMTTGVTRDRGSEDPFWQLHERPSDGNGLTRSATLRLTFIVTSSRLSLTLAANAWMEVLSKRNGGGQSTRGLVGGHICRTEL